ncbi:MAG: hypothetical protein ACI87N_002585 [Flavobacteriales bacterium]|jgi:hypothetical protein
MKKQLKLYMVMLGCTPQGRLTEQHDIFFGIGSSLKDLVPEMKAFWPEAKGKIHIDAWREISSVDNYTIEVFSRSKGDTPSEASLFFINLGGYKKGEFEEYHYKMVTVAKTLGIATRKVKTTTFFKHCGFEGAGASHIDDKYGIDVDETHRVNDLLDLQYKEKYSLLITKSDQPLEEDPLHIGYVKIKTISV